MWLTVVLGIVNIIVSSIGTYALGLPGFDITPIGVIMIAHAGESPLVGAVVLTIAYMLPRPSRFGWFVLQAPSAWLIGWMSVQFDIIVVPILVFHVISVAVGIVTGTFTGRYVMYTFINLGLNLAVGRVYGFTL